MPDDGRRRAAAATVADERRPRRVDGDVAPSDRTRSLSARGQSGLGWEVIHLVHLVPREADPEGYQVGQPSRLARRPRDVCSPGPAAREHGRRTRDTPRDAPKLESFQKTG